MFRHGCSSPPDEWPLMVLSVAELEYAWYRPVDVFRCLRKSVCVIIGMDNVPSQC